MVRYLIYTIGDLTYQSPLVVGFSFTYLSKMHDHSKCQPAASRDCLVKTDFSLYHIPYFICSVFFATTSVTVCMQITIFWLRQTALLAQKFCNIRVSETRNRGLALSLSLSLEFV